MLREAHPSYFRTISGSTIGGKHTRSPQDVSKAKKVIVFYIFTKGDQPNLTEQNETEDVWLQVDRDTR